ncbi:MAG TPA: VRR-NUC domain-containing protein, partial [Myxococcota bacterium]|nr:VRR-NUC domain-containing protein [Myxococcota bacterium]
TRWAPAAARRPTSRPASRNSAGWLSLQASYPYKGHAKTKGQRVREIAGPAFSDFLRGLPRTEYYQAPDLFVFRPDGSDWFLCEVKGPKDKVQPNQSAFFPRLVDAGARLALVTLSEHPEPSLRA